MLIGIIRNLKNCGAYRKTIPKYHQTSQHTISNYSYFTYLLGTPLALAYPSK